MSDISETSAKIMLPAGSSGAKLIATTMLNVSGPDAIVVVRDPDGQLRDLSWIPDTDTLIEPVAMSSPDGLGVLRHSCAHVMAQAVQDIFPDSKLGMGPPIENGYYYDFAVEQAFTPEDLVLIEAQMKRIIKAGQKFERRVFPTIADARLELRNEPYKLELLEDSTGLGDAELMETGGSELSIYDNKDAKSGETCWSDLCRGPHLPNTKLIYASKLVRNAAAYWRGSESNVQLQRIYGTAWASKDDLKIHLRRLEEAAKRDHRRIGEELELFTFAKEVGKGLPLWLPNGTIIRDELEQWARDTERRRGYQRVVTPHITREDLYYLSGHLPYYTEDLYAPIDIEGDRYYLKPMNCPHHHMIFSARPRSYRELPFRIAEYGTVYRFERSGQLHGLMRVRGFAQNDGHIYCTREQAKEEFLEVMRLHDFYYRTLGIEDFYMVLALRDPNNTSKYHDDEEMWTESERITRQAMEESGIPFVEDVGGAAHYGPKVDFMIRSVTGKEFAASTNQVDLYTPDRFGLVYRDSDGTEKPVVVIHRAPLGSHERFVGYLTEHYAGAFPLWLAPEQVAVIPVMPEVNGYAQSIADQLTKADVRAKADLSDSRLGAKVRLAVSRKTPLVVVVGRREESEQTVTVRYRFGKDEITMAFDQFVTDTIEAINSKSLFGCGIMHDVPSA